MLCMSIIQNFGEVLIVDIIKLIFRKIKFSKINHMILLSLSEKDSDSDNNDIYFIMTIVSIFLLAGVLSCINGCISRENRIEDNIFINFDNSLSAEEDYCEISYFDVHVTTV